MNKKMTPQQNQANMQNANKGTPGTNKQYDMNQGNKGKQMNPLVKLPQQSGKSGKKK